MFVSRLLTMMVIGCAITLGLMSPLHHVQADDDAPVSSENDFSTTDFSAADIEFFEKSIRPIFIEHCHACHGPDEQEAHLRLDSRQSILRGGDTGPAIVPGQPDESELIRAIHYEPDGYQMPPDGKLSDAHIAALTKWVEMHAPWPLEQSVDAAPTETFNLAERAEYWAFQPLERTAPPAVENEPWCRGEIDRFVLSKLEQQQWQPAPVADRRTWLRRASLDTIGLPPTIEQLHEFLADESSGAPERAIDRLLSSPHFGERWARHWLDLVRYAESRGHEFDHNVANPWHYRDYVIRACNDDVPYDQFVVEHIAGDLLTMAGSDDESTESKYRARIDPETGANESVVATGFWFFGEWVHSPVDIRQDEADRFDNMIDVFSKTFLGLTVSCARCHDHKFDPVTQQDFYALQGYLQSSRYRQVRFESMEHNRAIKQRLDELDHAAATALLDGIGSDVINDATSVSPSDLPDDSIAGESFSQDGISFTIAGQTPASRVRLDATTDLGFEWLPVGTARFDPAVAPESETADHLAEPGKTEKWRRSGRTLSTPTFEIEHDRFWLLVQGGCNTYVAVDSHMLIKGPLHDSIAVEHPQPKRNADQWRWIAHDVSRYRGHRAHVEIVPRDSETLLVAAVVHAADQPPMPDFASLGLSTLSPGRVDELREIISPFLEERKELLSQLRRTSHTAPAMIDGSGEDEYVFLRGNPKKRGETVPRRFLEVFDGQSQERETHEQDAHSGSGRLDLALHLVDAERTPLTSRVIVNRIWQHYFGAGLVRTPDDFGHMGQLPSHPELLDWLATELIEHDWSLKHIHRLILRSATYRMSCIDTDPQAVNADPGNRWLSHMNIKRLEGEIIRDSILAVSGRLDDTMYGPSVPVHLSQFMEGRGRPSQSGPVDGNGRRSIYLSVRRNFQNPFFQAFDFPNPHSTVGRRSVSNVPAQALAMLNNPLVVEQSQRWAQRMLAEPDLSVEDRIRTMYETAYSRLPSEEELAAGRQFIGEATDEEQTWSDYAHVLLNAKEFLFVR